jgi:dipeptidyl aminopeptidase/acylaminoacyl peptidase
MSQTKKSKKIWAIIKHDAVLFGVFLVVLLLSGLYLLRTDWQKGHSKAGSFETGRSDSIQAYKNLDLSVAATANYTGSPVQTVKDLGVARGAQHKVFRFAVHKDNLIEGGLMTLPTTPPPPGGYPVLVLCHGYVNPTYYSTENAYLYDMELYSRNGFAVLKPDYRGQGVSISVGSPDGAYYSMAYNTDVLSLVADIKQTPDMNKDNINMWGHSMGAYIALRASVLSKDIKNTILLSGPVGTIQDMYSSYVAVSDSNNATAAAIRSQELSRHGTPLTNADYWDKTSPLKYLDQSKTSYQIHVGAEDRLVPPKFSAELNNALTKLNKPHQYFIYPTGDHGLWNMRQTIWSRSLEQLNS